MTNKQNGDIPVGATHRHKYNGGYYCVGNVVTRYIDGKWESPYEDTDVKGWLYFLEPIEQPSVKPYNAFIADLDKLIHQRGLDLLNAMQRKLEASEGIPVEWINELMDYHGVSH